MQLNIIFEIVLIIIFFWNCINLFHYKITSKALTSISLHDIKSFIISELPFSIATLSGVLWNTKK